MPAHARLTMKSFRVRRIYCPSDRDRNLPTSMAIRMVMYNWPVTAMSTAMDRARWETG